MRRSPRRPPAVVGGVLLAVLILSVAAMQGCRAAPPAAPGPGASSPAGTARVAKVFIPATHTEDANVVMPVTFLDGTTAEIVYPEGLGLAEMGAVPYGSGQLDDPPLRCCARDFLFRYGDLSSFAQSNTAKKDYPGQNRGNVGLFSGQSGGPDYLVFTIGEWRLGVWDSDSDAMSDELRSLWSAHLGGRVSADGFPVLTATSPVRLAPFGETHGPSLEFGRVASNDSVTFRPTRTCPRNYVEPKVADMTGDLLTLVLCRADWSMQVNVTGDRDFAERVVDGLVIRDVHLSED